MNKLSIKNKVALRDQRIINCGIDGMIILILVLVTTGFNTSFFNLNVIGGAIAFLYYFLFELLFSKTPGKFITKTRVIIINKESDKPRAIFIRTLIRLIPIDPLTFFYNSNPVGWHDNLSGTLVIDESNGLFSLPWLHNTQKILKFILYFFLIMLLLLFLSIFVFIFNGSLSISR